MPMSVRVTASGRNDAGSVAVAFVDNQGTVDFWGSGPVAALLYNRDPTPENGYTLIGGFAVTDGAWMIFWLYCAPDGTLGGFAGERTDRTEMLLENMTGTCAVTSVNWNMAVQIPAHTLAHVPMTCGFSVADPTATGVLDLQSGQPGTASLQLDTLDSSPATALVFNTADCRTGCGGAPAFELHSIVFQPSGTVAFAIWYLEGTNSGQGVSAENGFVLPAVGGWWTPISEPRATWTLDR